MSLLLLLCSGFTHGHVEFSYSIVLSMSSSCVLYFQSENCVLPTVIKLLLFFGSNIYSFVSLFVYVANVVDLATVHIGTLRSVVLLSFDYKSYTSSHFL